MHINRIEDETVGAAAALGQHGVGLALHGAGKSYAGRTVLAGIDLQLTPGEFVAVVGRSGCGKSTLLRVIAGLEQLDEGNVQIGSSVKGDVRITLPKYGQRAAAALATVGLESRARDWPTVLSGGQRQRVALARALVHEPRLLLLDEPLGALDALTRIEMQQLIEKLWLARGFTVVLVTHDVQEALALADRVLLIEDGKLALDVRVDLPRPGRRGTPAFSALEQKVLDRVLGNGG